MIRKESGNPEAQPEGAIDVVMLCGGKGARLGALSAATPKPLLPIRGVPFLLHRLVALRREGVGQVILAVHYLAERFHEFVQEYAELLPDVTVVQEPAPLGTGGALRYAAHSVRSSVFAALNGDSWVSQPVAPVVTEHRQTGRPFTMVVVRAERVEGGARQKGLVSVSPHGEILRCSRGDAGGDIWVHAGLSVLDTELVLGWPSGSYDFDQRLTSLIIPPVSGHAFRSEGRLLDIGTPECYDLAHQLLKDPATLMSRFDSSSSPC